MLTAEQIIANALWDARTRGRLAARLAARVAAALRAAGIDLDHRYQPSEFGAAYGDCVFVRRPLEETR